MRNLWTCPECGAPSRLRHSRHLPGGPDLSYQQCTEPACGWCGQAQHSVRKTTTPSALAPAAQLARQQAVAETETDETRPQWRCPACHSRCRVRSSKQLLPDYRMAYLHCTFGPCGWTGQGDYVVLETVSPSGIPNPGYARRLAAHLPYRAAPAMAPLPSRDAERDDTDAAADAAASATPTPATPRHP
ncbi:ogr/Delta-like zinc finger family protein [Salinicola tamaricis]|uniref:ogr/Delta-like zinc finger family protein n=1 Tax=Salinicola tamaricis TaxID=1771309 RepID=UPI000D09AB78|nr:ogr/Delta-like zinc finger family protein [Salinicola tamaricis]